MARSLMETSDGRPSSLAHSLSRAGAEASSSDPSIQRTAAEAIAQINGAAGRLLTKDERKRLAQAIENSDSLEEIRRLEERLRLGYGSSGGNAGAKRKSIDGGDVRENGAADKKKKKTER